MGKVIKAFVDENGIFHYGLDALRHAGGFGTQGPKVLKPVDMNFSNRTRQGNGWRYLIGPTMDIRSKLEVAFGKQKPTDAEFIAAIKIIASKQTPRSKEDRVKSGKDYDIEGQNSGLPDETLRTFLDWAYSKTQDQRYGEMLTTIKNMRGAKHDGLEEPDDIELTIARGKELLHSGFGLKGPEILKPAIANPFAKLKEIGAKRKIPWRLGEDEIYRLCLLLANSMPAISKEQRIKSGKNWNIKGHSFQGLTEDQYLRYQDWLNTKTEAEQVADVERVFKTLGWNK